MCNVLQQINIIVTKLNGVPVTPNSVLKDTRLESYALAVFFYKLNTVYPIFELSYALMAIAEDYSIEQLIERVNKYEQTKNI